jgi:hypothetical protein
MSRNIIMSSLYDLNSRRFVAIDPIPYLLAAIRWKFAAFQSFPLDPGNPRKPLGRFNLDKPDVRRTGSNKIKESL